jgi:hypothetical protein
MFEGEISKGRKNTFPALKNRPDKTVMFFDRIVDICEVADRHRNSFYAHHF